MSPLVGPRVIARVIDLLTSLFLYQALDSVISVPISPVGAMLIYSLCVAAFGQSLGKSLCGLRVHPEKPARLLMRELLLWLLAPFVVLSLFGQAPLHDRMTQCRVEYD